MQGKLVERFGQATAEQLLSAAGRDAAGGSSNLIYYPVVLLLKAPLDKVGVTGRYRGYWQLQGLLTVMG